MPEGLPDQNGQGSSEPPLDYKLLLKWLESQPDTLQKGISEKTLNELLERAAQPRHASGNACIKLCYFIEQCRTSQSSAVRQVAFSEKSCLDLFNFYVEWNEKNQNRSMRQVLELVSSLIAQNPDKSVSGAIKTSILHRNISIITHQAAQPLVKPAFKSLECFLSKGTISTDDLLHSYHTQNPENANSAFGPEDGSSSVWDVLFSEVFDWMTLPDVSPAAGKFLVTVFRELRSRSQISDTNPNEHSTSWQRWIRRGLSKNPQALENVKNYLFPPLFKLDRPGSLAFLENLNKQRSMSNFQSQYLDAHALLQLAAIDVGKKSSLIEEPSTIQLQKAPKKSAATIVLQEESIRPLLFHASETVRSLAFSVLVSSSSSVRPFSPNALDILQECMGILYSDTDAKFRNEVLSNTRHMIERLKGATGLLAREIDSLSFALRQNSGLQLPAQQVQSNDTTTLLERHERFIEWYVEFLLGELIPTSSYQRHITSLKAISILITSGILEQESTRSLAQIPDHATMWPFKIQFFTSGSIRLLLDLLLDPFEDVRSSATAILKLARAECFTLRLCGEEAKNGISPNNMKQYLDPENGTETSHQSIKTIAGCQQNQDGQILGLLMEFVGRAEDASKRTGRADYADGVARSYELLYSLLSTAQSRIKLFGELVDELGVKVDVAEQDLGRAVLEAPIHGTFAALNLVWDTVDHSRDLGGDASQNGLETQDQWSRLQLRMYQYCRRIWNTVSDVLCNDSPEGHLPQELDEVETIDTKDVLSYSFRAVHESSNLMRTMVGKVKSRWLDGLPVLPAEIFTNIGDLTFEQLSNLRHRGAFSTVSLTFARCCQLTQHQDSNPTSISTSLLQTWYQGTLKCIYEQASTTRRSAGIPALVTGVLSANSHNPAFQDVMAELKSLARQPVRLSETDETNLPQVHAMNCLKEVFKSSTLGKRSESHIADCLQLAADSLNSEIWAIRNCGLIFLRSLIDSLFGTSESKFVTEAGWDGRSIKLSYDKYPALPDLLLRLLETETNSSYTLSRPAIGAVESVFPALDIIRRAGPPSSHREDIFRRVSLHLGSKVWHVREIAARTICTLLLHDGWLPAVLGLIETAGESTNRHHGVLMAVKFILERRLALDPNSATDGLADVAIVLNTSLHFGAGKSIDPQVLAAGTDVNNTIAMILLASSSKQLNSVEQRGRDNIMELLFSGQNTLEFIKSLSLKTKTPYALSHNARARQSIYTTALNDAATEPTGLEIMLGIASKASTDVTLAALECVPHVFRSEFQVYIAAIEETKSTEVRCLALTNLAESLDQTFKMEFSSKELLMKLQYLAKILQQSKGSPQLSNAEIRISGWVLLAHFVDGHIASSESIRLQMQAWGRMLATAGDSYNDFDTRYAAVKALRSFYQNIPSHLLPRDKCFLSSLLALYDTLNDDDDDIRDVGAETVSSITRKSLVPLAAREEIVKYLVFVNARTTSFVWSVVQRMTGNNESILESEVVSLKSAESQFSEALLEDDALFVEEEQNLFVDEVREMKLWSNVLGELTQQSREALYERPASSEHSRPLEALAMWTADGLATLNKTLKADGPQGWTSKPSAFAASMRVLVCVNAVLRLHTQYSLLPLVPENSSSASLVWDTKVQQILDGLEVFLATCQHMDLHPTLLSELLSLASISMTKLDTLLPGVSLSSAGVDSLVPTLLHLPRPREHQQQNLKK